MCVCYPPKKKTTPDDVDDDKCEFPIHFTDRLCRFMTHSNIFIVPGVCAFDSVFRASVFRCRFAPTFASTMRWTAAPKLCWKTSIHCNAAKTCPAPSTVRDGVRSYVGRAVRYAICFSLDSCWFAWCAFCQFHRFINKVVKIYQISQNLKLIKNMQAKVRWFATAARWEDASYR